MEKALEILQHIEKLYAKDYNENYARNLAKKNPDMVEMWQEAFGKYDLVDVLAAINEFWQFKSSKSRPNVAQITAILSAKKVDTEDNSAGGMRRRILKCADEVGDKYGSAARERYLKAARANWPEVDLSGHEWTEPEILECEKVSTGDYAVTLMQRDIKLNRCQHLLPEYQAAVRYIAEDMLSQEIPASEWQKMSFSERCAMAMKRGLFNQFDDVLVLVCRQRQGKDFQFEANKMIRPFNANQAVNYLGAHYRTDEADFARAAGM